MKNRNEFKDYGKGVLSFGKHKGKTIKEIITDCKDYGYIVWLRNNVKRITVSDFDYNYCKQMTTDDKAMREAIMGSNHSNYGCWD
jgi:hypothetical protein